MRACRRHHARLADSAMTTLEPWYQRGRGAVPGARRRRRRIRPSRRTPGATRSRRCPTSRRSPTVRARLRARRASAVPLPLAVDIDRWLAARATPWDAFPDTRAARWMPRRPASPRRSQHPNVTLVTGARVDRLRAGPDGRIAAVEYARTAATRRLVAAPVVAVGRRGQLGRAAAALGERRHPTASPTAPDQVGRNFMNHNCSARAGDRPAAPQRRRSTRRRFVINDFYLDRRPGRARRSATCSCSAGSPARILAAACAGLPRPGRGLARAPSRRLLR